MATEQLLVRLKMDARQYNKEAKQAANTTGSISQQAKGAATATGGLQNRMIGFGSVLRGAAVLGGVAALGHGIGESINRAEEMSSAYAITEQVIRQTGGAANLTAEEIKNLSKEQSLLTGVDKALITEGNNVLLTFKNIKNEAGEGNDVFERTSNLMLDISATMGTDAKSAALQLGKALNDPISQMGALSRAGLTFTQEQKDQIKSLVASGDLLSAQKLILEELESQLGGTAAASADASDKIANHFKELAETFGTALLPVLDDVVRILGAFFASTDLQRWAIQTGQAAGSAELLAGAVSLVADKFEDANIFASDGTEVIFDFRQQVEELVTSSGAADSELRKLRDGLDFLVESGRLSAGEAQILADILADELAPTSQDMADHVAALEDELNILHGTTKDVGEASAEAVPSVEALAFQLEREAAAAKAAREEQAKYRTALREAIDPLARIIGLSQDHADKQKTLNEAVDKYGSASDEAREAALELAGTNSDLRAAFDELRTQGIDPTSAAAQLMFQDLGIPPEVLAGILDDFSSIQNYLDNNPLRMDVIVNDFHVPTPATRGGSPRQHGGPVTGRQPYIVGERGPELFVPQTSGHVISNADIKQLIAGLAGAGGRNVNYNIPITSSGNQNADAQLVGAVASVLRRMETL